MLLEISAFSQKQELIEFQNTKTDKRLKLELFCAFSLFIL